MTNGVTGVVGTDGNVPIYDPNGLWRIWSVNQIYQGQQGQNRYVPKLDDYIIDPPTFTTWIVDALDPVTLIPTLREIRPANMSYSFSETDILFGVGPGTQADTYRAYLDKRTMPYTLSVDARLKIHGSMASYVKIFKGSVHDNTGKIISKVYDSAGNFVSVNVPLEVAEIDDRINIATKSVRICNTTEELVDNEIVTVVVYSDNGTVVSKRQLLIENTSFIPSINASLRYISHIALKCPFLSPTTERTIEFPLNIPLNALNLIGQVYYSDGEILELPVDGTKFKMLGMDQYVSNIVGQRIPLVLSYALSSNETSYAGVGVDANYVTEPYDLVTVNQNNSYAVKLFGYPFWVDAATGYQMRWWLLNLDRNIYFEVTPHVVFDASTGPFNPTAYGYMQRKSVSINLRNVSGAFKPFTHVQIVDIVLNGEPIPETTPWVVSHEANSSRPSYGLGLYADKISSNVVNLTSGITTQTEWLEKVYLNTFPLVNPNTEVGPLQPTHFVVTYDGLSTEYPIASWDQNLNVANSLVNYRTLSIRFVKRTASGDLNLAVSALIIKP